MSGWDEGRVFVSDVALGQLQAVSQTSEAEQQRVLLGQAERRFVEFLRNFTDADSNFIYREQLVRQSQLKKSYVAVSVDQLLAFDAELGECITQQPNLYLPLLEAACSKVAQQLTAFGGAARPSAETAGTDAATGAATADAGLAAGAGGALPMQVVLQWKAMPMHIRQLQSDNISRLVVVRGIVISSSKVKAKAQQLHIVCRNCKAGRTIPVRQGFGGVSLPRVCDSAQATAANEGHGIRCPLDPYVIVPDRSLFADQQTLKLQEAPETVPTGEMPRHILCSVDRNLVGLATPGMRVLAVGVYSIFSSGDKATGVALRQPYVRIVGLVSDESSSVSSSVGGGGRTVHRALQSEVQQYKSLAQDPRCIEQLVASVDPAIFGQENIKKAVACLLFGGSAKTPPTGTRVRGDINVLLLGDPSTAKSQFLKFVEKVAPIGVYTSGKGSSAAGLTASVVRDPGTGEFYLEGGSMVLADGGVVCIDEFDKMRAADRVAIHEAMEQQTISIAKAGITTILNSRTAVLAAANPLAGRYDDMKSAADQIDFQSSILSRFDLLFLVRDIRDEQRDRDIASHVIRVHTNANGGMPFGGMGALRGSNGGVGAVGGPAVAASHGGSGDAGTSDIPIAFYKRYIAYARASCHPRIDEAAAQKLEDFFVKIRNQMRERASRADKSSSRMIPITVRQLEAIVRVSEALARMTLSNTATVDHVEQAIALFKVSTMEAANSGVGLDEEYMSAEIRAELQQAEAEVRRIVGVNQTVATSGLMDQLRKKGFNQFAATKALHVLERKGDITYLHMAKLVRRLR